MSTTLTKEQFDEFVSNATLEIETAYNTLKTADTKFSRINDYQGAYQAALANSWSANYSRAVSGLSDLYNAVSVANKAATNIIETDKQVAGNRP